MAVGKNKIIVDATNYKKSADPFRTVTGKYWTRERESQFSLLKKGFTPDAVSYTHLTLPPPPYV